jgi:uncharacterized protein (TIRG00374 family)
MGGSSTRRRGAFVAGLVIAVLFALLIAAMDGRAAAQRIRGAEWGLIPVAVFFALLSYSALSTAFSFLLGIFGVKLRRRDVIEIAFVTGALNNLVALGGVAGYSIRVVLLRRRGSSLADVLSASLIHSYFNHLVLLALVPSGILYLILRHPLPGGEQAGLAAAGGLFLLLLMGMTFLLLSSRARAFMVRLLGRAVGGVIRRDVETHLRELDVTLSRGLDAIRARRRVLVAPVLLVLTDWASTSVVLMVCFAAFGHTVPLGVVLSGFAIGVAAGAVSMLPGGMGVQEGSMAGVYTLLGVPYEQAVLTALLFRIVFYVIPFTAGLPLYRRLLRETPEEAPAAAYEGTERSAGGGPISDS